MQNKTFLLTSHMSKKKPSVSKLFCDPGRAAIRDPCAIRDPKSAIRDPRRDPLFCWRLGFCNHVRNWRIDRADSFLSSFGSIPSDLWCGNIEFRCGFVGS